MINLLSDVKKTEIRAARTNTILLRYIIVLTVALLFIGGAIFVSWQSLKTSEQSADAQIELTQNSPATPKAPEQAIDTTGIASALDDQKASRILTAIGASLPKGAILRNISLTHENIQGTTPIALTVYLKQDSTPGTITSALTAAGVFTNVSVTSTSSSDDLPGYPVKTEISATVIANTGQNPQGSIIP